MSTDQIKTFSRLPWYISTTRVLRLVLALVMIIPISLMPRQVSTAQTSWQWYKTDLHAHSVISADAYTDLGIMSRSAIAQGYNAVFLTDHNLASNFPISSLTANHMIFEDSYTRWTSANYGTATAKTNALATAPINTGTKSLRLASSASAYAETFVWTNRGPNFRSGDIILKFSVYPKRIDPGSGVYVSASIGGDMTVQSPDGYTTSSGVVSPGKSIVLVWQLGSARAASSDANRRVLTYPLTYTLNTWNHYTINISDYLEDIPVAERPVDYNALTYLKMAAGANNGTAEAYFDTYSINSLAPVAAADEFVYRTSMIDSYDTPTFKVFPSLEMGVSDHAQRFNFGINHPSEFLSYWDGIVGILPAQQSGYPAMINHPGSSGGISDQDAIQTQGAGADLIEVRQQGWIDNWDAILQQGVQILGTGTSDTHRVFSGSSFATYVYGPELSFDSLMHSIFDGRTYIAAGSFGNQGRVIFNLDSSSQQPYPARYPVYVPGMQTSVNVHLFVTGGLKSGYTIRWIRNDTLMATDSTAGASYETTKAIPLGGAWTYVRAEIRDSSGALRALTQPIFFIPVSGLPADKNYSIDNVTTANGRQYTKLFIKGITESVWDATAQAITLTLNNPVDTLVDMRLRTAQAPQSVLVNGGSILAADSLTAFQAASNSRWYYDSATGLLYLKALHAGETATVSVGFASAGPTRTPTPTGSATLSPTVTLSPTSTSTRTSTPTGTPTLTATATQVGQQQFTFTPVADAYVKSTNPSTNYGNSTTLRTDNSPITRSYLRFNVQGLSASINRATLRIYANTSSNSGYIVNGLANNAWVETSINYSNAPLPGSQIGPSRSVASTNWIIVDVTSYITGNGDFNIVLTGASSTEISLASRESGANAPQLVIETGSTPTLTPSYTPSSALTASPTLLTATASSTPTLISPTPSYTPTGISTASPTLTTATVSPTPTRTPTETSVMSSFTFTPISDAYVNEGSPASNYGSLTTLRADGSPLVRSYLRFDVQGLSGTVTRVTLRIFTNSSSSVGYEVRNIADNTWVEGSINHTNAPAVDGVAASSGPFGAGVWKSVDITPLITGNGTYNIALTTTSSTAFSLASRESGANAPQLVIETTP